MCGGEFPAAHTSGTWRFVESYINPPKFHLPEASGAFRIIGTDMASTPRRHSLNLYLMDSLRAIGGGADKLLAEMFGYKRLGGSTADKVNYFRMQVNVTKLNMQFITSMKGLFKQFVGADFQREYCLMPFSEMMDKFTYNGEAAGGFFDKAYGFKDKKEVLPLNIIIYKCVRTMWCDDPASPVSPGITWSTGSRPKLIKLSENMEKIDKIRAGDPACRVICVGPLIESLLGFPLYYDISERIKKFFKLNGYGIAIGCNRMGSDWARISKHFEGAKYIMVGDYSKFDQSIPPDLLSMGLDALLNTYIVTDPYTENYISNYKRWFKQNIISSTHIIDDKVIFQANGGMPSGTLWTSLLNSVMNMIIIYHTCTRLKVKNYKPVVYGDDHIIIIYDEIGSPSKFVSDYRSHVFSTFGMKMGDDDTYISRPSEFFVTYKRPIYDPKLNLELGTSKLEPLSFEYSQTPFPEPEYSLGQTHRWQYNFAKRPRFLQYYWLRSGCAIRPMRESLLRILHPEDDIKKLDEHQVVLISHLYDNYHNAHVRNWIFHLMYDVEFMKSCGMSKANLFIQREDKGKSYYDKHRDPGSRMWYRRVNVRVNLSSEPSMICFIYKWKQILQQIDDLLTQETSLEPYQLKRFIMSRLSTGVVSHEKAWDMYKSGELTLNQYMAYKSGGGFSPPPRSEMQRAGNLRHDDLVFDYIISQMGGDPSAVHAYESRIETPTHLFEVVYRRHQGNEDSGDSNGRMTEVELSMSIFSHKSRKKAH